MSVLTIGTWEGEGVSVSQIEGALADIRRHDRRAAVRTSVLTLVVVAHDQGTAEAALKVIEGLGRRHPSRAIVITLDDSDLPPGTAPLDAAASVHVVQIPGSAGACFEEVRLRARGRARHHLDSVVEPFALPDVPVVVWLPNTLPSPGDPLLASADRIIIDSRAVAEELGLGAGGPGQGGPGQGGPGQGGPGQGGPGSIDTGDRRAVLPRIAALSRRLPVTDLSWGRLATWRDLLAGMFDSPEYRPFLAGVEKVEVAGNFGPRHLLGGWLLRRLDLEPEQVSLTAATHVSVRVTAAVGRRHGTFTVERTGPERVVHAEARLDDGPCTRQALTMRRQWTSSVLAVALTRMGPDEYYRQALGGAVELVARSEAR